MAREGSGGCSPGRGQTSVVGKDRQIAWLWFCTLGSLMVSEGPAVLIGMATSRAGAAEVPAVEGNRPFDVLMRNAEAERVQTETALLWVSGTLGAAMLLASLWMCAILFRRGTPGARRHAAVAAAVLALLVLHALSAVGVQPHPRQGLLLP